MSNIRFGISHLAPDDISTRSRFGGLDEMPGWHRSTASVDRFLVGTCT